MLELRIAAELLERYYDIRPRFLRQVPGGSTADAFSADGQYFLKIYDDVRPVTARCTERLEDQLWVLLMLAENSPLSGHVCRPVPTTEGELFCRSGPLTGVVFGFIPGETIGWKRPYTSEEAASLAGLVRTLHGIDPAPFREHCPEEKYQVDFLDSLEKLICSGAISLDGDFHFLAEKYSEALLRAAEEVRMLADTLREKKLPHVLCHTDIHGGNLIRNEKCHLWLIDWENVLLAPKEADLFAFSGRDDFALFADHTDKTALRYYLVRRDLEDVWEYFDGQLHGQYGPDEQKEVLDHLRRILSSLE